MIIETVGDLVSELLKYDQTLKLSVEVPAMVACEMMGRVSFERKDPVRFRIRHIRREQSEFSVGDTSKRAVIEI